MISFNKSVIDKEDFKCNHDPYQIMISRYKFISRDVLDMFPKIDFENKILIHTSYITKIFTSNALKSHSKTRYNLNGYNDIATKLNTKYILIHGPCSIDEYNNFGFGLQLIDDVFKDSGKIICLEIPSFTKTIYKFKIIDLNFIKHYFDTILAFKTNGYKIQIIIDTAHLHSNGLDIYDMMELLEIYKNDYEFIHLNGNIKPRYSPDEHCPIIDDKNKISNTRFLLKYLSGSGKICISETVTGDWNYWIELCKEFGLNLVERNDLYSF